jgi:hypothetical protein
MMLLLSAARQEEAQREVLFDDFSSSTVGEFPSGWRWRRNRSTGDVAKARRDGVDIFRYIVRETDGNKFLHARDEHRPGHSVSVYLETKDLFSWEIEEYPILSWRWRVNELPPNADERYTETNDTPASVLVLYGTKFPFTPIAIKYVWSSTLPLGAVAYRPGRGRPYNIVLGSGTERLGEWVTIERNVYDDYVAIFDKNPPDKPTAIVLSTDANRTPGAASDADYDDFRVLSRYSEGFPREPFELLFEYMEGNR